MVTFALFRFCFAKLLLRLSVCTFVVLFSCCGTETSAQIPAQTQVQSQSQSQIEPPNEQDKKNVLMQQNDSKKIDKNHNNHNITTDYGMISTVSNHNLVQNLHDVSEIDSQSVTDVSAFHQYAYRAQLTGQESPPRSSHLPQLPPLGGQAQTQTQEQTQAQTQPAQEQIQVSPGKERGSLTRESKATDGQPQSQKIWNDWAFSTPVTLNCNEYRLFHDTETGNDYFNDGNVNDTRQMTAGAVNTAVDANINAQTNGNSNELIGTFTAPSAISLMVNEAGNNQQQHVSSIWNQYQQVQDQQQQQQQHPQSFYQDNMVNLDLNLVNNGNTQSSCNPVTTQIVQGVDNVSRAQTAGVTPERRQQEQYRLDFHNLQSMQDFPSISGNFGALNNYGDSMQQAGGNINVTQNEGQTGGVQEVVQEVVQQQMQQMQQMQETQQQVEELQQQVESDGGTRQVTGQVTGRGQQGTDPMQFPFDQTQALAPAMNTMTAGVSSGTVNNSIDMRSPVTNVNINMHGNMNGNMNGNNNGNINLTKVNNMNNMNDMNSLNNVNNMNNVSNISTMSNMSSSMNEMAGITNYNYSPNMNEMNNQYYNYAGATGNNDHANINPDVNGATVRMTNGVGAAAGYDTNFYDGYSGASGYFNNYPTAQFSPDRFYAGGDMNDMNSMNMNSMMFGSGTNMNDVNNLSMSMNLTTTNNNNGGYNVSYDNINNGASSYDARYITSEISPIRNDYTTYETANVDTSYHDDNHNSTNNKSQHSKYHYNYKHSKRGKFSKRGSGNNNNNNKYDKYDKHGQHGQHQHSQQQQQQQSQSQSQSQSRGNGSSGEYIDLKMVKTKDLAFTPEITLGHCIKQEMILTFAKDQYGSRFIQKQLEMATMDEKNSILRQIDDNILELCENVFGNYIIQKLFEYGSNKHKIILAEKLIGKVYYLSKSMYGCRVIQKAFECLSNNPKSNNKLMTQLLRELHGHTEDCIVDPNGNHVIQKCIAVMPNKRDINFIIETFVPRNSADSTDVDEGKDPKDSKIFEYSVHPYGCRVIQRLLEYCSLKQQKTLLKEILKLVTELSKDQYGNYVIQHVLEHDKTPNGGEARFKIIQIVANNMLYMSKNKFGSNVVEKAFIFAKEDGNERDMLVDGMIGDINGQNGVNSPLRYMVSDQFGNYVVQKVLDVVNEEQRIRLFRKIKELVPNLAMSTYGVHIISKMEKLRGKNENMHGSQGNNTRHGSGRHSHSHSHSHSHPHHSRSHH